MVDVAIEEPMTPAFQRIGGFGKQCKLFGALVHGFCADKQIGSIYSINPRSMKKIFTGNGNAQKDRIITRAKLYYNVDSWPMSKADKEALADAIGIGYSLWKHQRFERNGIHCIREVK